MRVIDPMRLDRDLRARAQEFRDLVRQALQKLFEDKILMYAEAKRSGRVEAP